MNILTGGAYERFRIHLGQYWDVYISEHGGNNLGRIYFWLKRDGIVDFHNLTDDELNELRLLERSFNKVIRELFQPDGPMNFAYLANDKTHNHHCHYHLVPRYETPRQFEEVTFIDPCPGKKWKSSTLEEAVAIAIGKLIMNSITLA